MNRWWIAAGVLALVTALVHVFAGGPAVAAPLLASSIDAVPRMTMYACWHLVSVALAGSAAALLLAARGRDAARSRALVLFVSALWLGFGAVILIVALQQPGDGWVWTMPQWIVLMPVGVLGLIGTRSLATSAGAPAMAAPIGR